MGDAPQHNTMTRGAINWLLTKLKNHTHSMIVGLGRVTSANVSSSKKNSMEVFMATSDIEGKPPQDASVFHSNWDKLEYASQLAVGVNGNPHAHIRALNASEWTEWRTLLDSVNWNSYAAAKPIYTFSTSGSDFMCATLRFPDTKVQISWAWKGVNTTIESAWGAGFLNADRITVGNWNQPFSDSSKLVSVATATPATGGTDCWVSTITGASTTSAGQYHLARQTKASTKQVFYVNVIAIGTYA